MKRSLLLVGTIIFSLTGLIFLAALFSTVPAEAAEIAPDLPYSVSAPPEITDLFPTYGYNDSVTTLLIFGSNYFTDTAVSLDAIQLSNVTFISSTSLLAEVPPGLEPGAYDVRVINSDGTQATWVDAYSVLTPTLPTILEVFPNKGPNNLPVTIDIYGKNFPDGSFGTLIPGFYPLDGLVYVNSAHLRAVVPQNIPTGVYTLEVSTPNENFVTLPNAYEAIDPAVNTDLFSSQYDLWRQPLTIRMGAPINPVIGLKVGRQGGSAAIPVVPIDFYMNGPSAAAGGILIGQTVAQQVQPNSFQPTLPLQWVPPGIGSVTIYAVIDPLNQTIEFDETNNIISRTIKVLPPLFGDTVPPIINGFRINNGALKTSLRQIILDTNALDNVGGSGVESILFAEYAYVQSAGAWLPVKVSDWLPYAQASSGQPATLVPTPGLHIFKVWVADKAGNVSAPATAFINFQPANVFIGAGEVHIYRLPLQANDSWRVQITMNYGTADLYVWDPADRLVDIRENVTTSDNINFTAGQNGVYQVEVEGQINSSYQLNITLGAGAGAAELLDFGSPSAVDGRAQPFVSVEEEPSDDVGLTDPPSTYYSVWLPTVLKD